MEDKRFYVYVHYCNNKLIYIGKGTGKRYLSKDYRNKHWNNTVNKHKDLSCFIVCDSMKETDAYELEEFLISEIGLNNLTNISLGGENFGTYDKSGKNNPMYGKTHPSKGKKMPQISHKGRLGLKHTKDSNFKNMINQPKIKGVVIDGVHYHSITKASIATGMYRSTISRRIKRGFYEEISK